VLDGRYELIKLVGTGGMGVVWRVFDREWGRDLALKLPRPVVLELARRCARGSCAKPKPG
jgi:serine/threonine protein kinase